MHWLKLQLWTPPILLFWHFINMCFFWSFTARLVARNPRVFYRKIYGIQQHIRNNIQEDLQHLRSETISSDNNIKCTPNKCM